MKDVVDTFSHHLRNVLTRALCLAVEMGRDTIEPEHLLWSTAAETGSIGCEILKKANIDADNLRTVIGAPETPLATNPLTSDPLPQLSEASKRVIEKAVLMASVYEHTHVGTEHLIAGMLQVSSPALSGVLGKVKADTAKIHQQLKTIMKGTQQFPHMHGADVPLLSSDETEHSVDIRTDDDSELQALEFFATELTDPEAAKELDPVVGRDQELLRVMEVLSRRTKNNPVLVGEPGVGKTAIAEGLARKIVEGSVPNALKNKRIWSLDLGSLVAGTVYRGEFEGRIKQIVDEVRDNPDIILFIDELHMIMGAGSGSGSMDAANMLKPALARGWIRCIGATTPDEYKKYLETDGALERRFQMVDVAEPSVATTRQILGSLASLYEDYHNVRFEKEAIDFAVDASVRYIQGRFLPDKAIDLIDEAAAALVVAKAPSTPSSTPLETELFDVRKQKQEAIANEQYLEAGTLKRREADLIDAMNKAHTKPQGPPIGTITAEDIARVIEKQTGIRVRNLLSQERKQLQSIERKLGRQVIGQTPVIKAVAQHVRRAKMGVNTGSRPLASFLFVGPSGTGKTELATQLAKLVFERNDALIRLDMSAFAESYSVSKLVGSPAGYVGYRDQNLLTDVVKKKPHALVLFDEIEKAHPDVHNLLLQILEHGELQDATGRTVSFRNCLIVLTSNIGAESLLNGQLGFSSQTPNSRDVQKLLHDAMRPELINRIDTIGVFKPLVHKDLVRVAERELKLLQARMAQDARVLSWDKDLRAHIVNASDAEIAGARNIRQIVNQLIAGLVADRLLTDPETKTLHVSINNDAIDVQPQTR